MSLPTNVCCLVDSKELLHLPWEAEEHLTKWICLPSLKLLEKRDVGLTLYAAGLCTEVYISSTHSS